MRHGVYESIVDAYNKGILKEPFTKEDFKKACPQWSEGTHSSFLGKHTKGNPYNISELFEEVTDNGQPRMFKFLRPFKYGMEDNR